MQDRKPEPDPMWRVIDQLSAHRDHFAQREQWFVGSVLTGREVTLLGRRARLRVEWLDGPPHGMTEEDLRRMGERMLPEERP